MSNYVTTINNKRIFDYYNSNTNVNIESMNLNLLDFMEQLGIERINFNIDETNKKIHQFLIDRFMVKL